MLSKYSLGFSNDTWRLYYSGFSPDMSLELKIKFGYHGDGADNDSIKDWNRYQFIVHEDGGDFEVATEERWMELYESIRENAGEAEATKWAARDAVMSPNMHGSKWYPPLVEFGKMVKHWECMIELGLFVPQINHTTSFSN